MGLMMVMVAVLALGASGVPGLVMGRRSRAGQGVAAILNVMASGVGIAGIILQFVQPAAVSGMSWAWDLPVGRFSVGLDDLSALFLIPIFLISALGSIYGIEYWDQIEHPGNGRKLRFAWGLLAGSMGMIVLARDAVLFLMAWEIMSLCTFVLTTTEENKEEVRRAGWIYLVASHFGAVVLLGFFAVLARVNGSLELWPVLHGVSGRAGMGLFVLGVVGFGFKAGIMPLHVWLPGAHANAPSHVSAIFSGVLLKMGIYGIVRVAGLVAVPPMWWGVVLLCVGTGSGVFGIALAAGQRDYKRLLAYSSIENIGIIVMGVGLALVGRALGRGDLVALGMGGALLHVLNHSLFKPLMFMGAGNVLHATRTRDMERLGGLGKKMPRTFGMFLLGSVAICGLPPLNGFVSELLIYLGLFRLIATQGGEIAWVSLAAGGLAIIGTMAVVSFVKFNGVVFCGSGRSEKAEGAHDPSGWMLGPMRVAAGLCLVVGIVPVVVVNLLGRAVSSWAGVDVSLGGLAPLGWVSGMAVGMGLLIGLGAMWIASIPRRTGATWGCGYGKRNMRMQYTASSFGQMLTDQLDWITWPVKRLPGISGAFPRRTEFASEAPDPALDRGLVPAFAAMERGARPLGVFQTGPIQVCILYVAVILLVLLLMR